jgi:hypothetical protein
MEQNGYSLTKEQIDEFHENGFLHLKNVFSNKYCLELLDEAEENSNGFYTNYLHFHRTGKFRKLIAGKTMCDIGDSLMDHKMIPCGSGFFFCKPNNPLEHGSVWHQDNYSVKAPFNSYLNLAVVLDDADESNGSLTVVPGSHKLGDLPNEPKPNFKYDEEGRLYQFAPIGNNCEVPEGYPIVNLTYNRGDVLCIHAHIVHKANKNVHETKWRRKIYLDYIKNGDPFWPGWTAKRLLLERYDSPHYKDED